MERFVGGYGGLTGTALMGKAVQWMHMEAPSTSNVPLWVLSSLKIVCTPLTVHRSIRNLFLEIDLKLISPIWACELLLILEHDVMPQGHVP